MENLVPAKEGVCPSCIKEFLYFYVHLSILGGILVSSEFSRPIITKREKGSGGYI